MSGLGTVARGVAVATRYSIALAAAVLSVSTPTTVLGAQLFFYARLAHAGLSFFRGHICREGIIGRPLRSF